MLNIDYDEENIYNDNNDDDFQDVENGNHNDVCNHDNVSTKHHTTNVGNQCVIGLKLAENLIICLMLKFHVL